MYSNLRNNLSLRVWEKKTTNADNLNQIKKKKKKEKNTR